MARAETPTAEELETAQQLRASLGRLSRLLRRTDADVGVDLTPTRVSVLLSTDRHGPLRLSEVADREGLNPTLLSRAVADLVGKGLVERTADPDDRRSAWLRATDHGHDVAEQIRDERTEVLKAALDLLPDAERELLRAALPAIEELAERLAGEHS